MFIGQIFQFMKYPSCYQSYLPLEQRELASRWMLRRGKFNFLFGTGKRLLNSSRFLVSKEQPPKSIIYAAKKYTVPKDMMFSFVDSLMF